MFCCSLTEGKGDVKHSCTGVACAVGRSDLWLEMSCVKRDDESKKKKEEGKDVQEEQFIRNISLLFKERTSDGRSFLGRSDVELVAECDRAYRR